MPKRGPNRPSAAASIQPHLDEDEALARALALSAQEAEISALGTTDSPADTTPAVAARRAKPRRRTPLKRRPLYPGTQWGDGDTPLDMVLTAFSYKCIGKEQERFNSEHSDKVDALCCGCSGLPHRSIQPCFTL